MNGISSRGLSSEGVTASGGATADADARRGCNARCPRCGNAFDCGVADAAPCACARVALDEPQRRFMASRWSGCLCLACLRAIADGATS